MKYLSVLVLHALAVARSSPSSPNVTVSPSVIYMEIPTLLTVTITAPAYFSGDNARCSIRSANSNYVDQNYTATGYNPMANVSARIINSTHLTCSTVALQNAGPGHLSISFDGGHIWADPAPIEIVPAFEWAVGRRPYVYEEAASIVYKAHPTLKNSALRVVGALWEHKAQGPRSAHDESVSQSGGAGVQFDKVLTFGSGVDAAPLDGQIPFSFYELPPTVYDDLVVTVTRMSDNVTWTKFKVFHRVPPPTPGSPNENVTVFSVNHANAGMLQDGWLPFAARGWFNSPFEYIHESVGDMSLVSAKVPLDVARGGSLVTEWGKKGHNLIRLGSDHSQNPVLLREILDECSRAGVYVMYSPPASTYATENTTEAFENLQRNLSAVMYHPALWGYYICDDCCKGYDYLWQLAWAYDAMKRIDPYHLTAGFAECGELHAFQEPFLSLDAPMRENYRPEPGFHWNDGSGEHPGSDGDLRLPPNTFEPIFNGLQSERQAVPKVARTNAYLGLITANLINHNWYVFNQRNYVRWQNTNIVDTIFAEFAALQPALYADHDASHPTVQVVGAESSTIRARAWREATGCVHLVVANGVAEGQFPAPAHFQLRVAGLSSVEIAAGATMLWDGCVVNFSSPKAQTYICRKLSLTPSSTVGSDNITVEMSDFVGVLDTNVYRIGCPLPRASSFNYVADPGFEGGTESSADGSIQGQFMTGMAGVPGYNLDDHTADWHLIYFDSDGIRNGRTYDDSTWLHIDSTLPHSGRYSGRVFLPEGQPSLLSIPCERGGETGATTKKDPVCKGGAVNVLNGTTYSVSLFARAMLEGSRVEILSGLSGVAGSSNVLGAATIGHMWTHISGHLDSSSDHFVGTTIFVRVQSPRAGSVWIDDAEVAVNATASLVV